MKQKTLTLIFGMIFLVGLVAAAGTRTITPTDGLIHIDNFTAGTEVQANFSYYYIRDLPENPDNSPLVLKVLVNSSDEDYPVWKNDFSINGYIERWNFIPWLIREIPFNCSENITEVVHPFGNTTIEPQNGTFYCFDPEGEMDFADFNTRDVVFLNILSNPALYPGQYNLTAEFFYVNDTIAPFVNILNKNYFETRYFRTGNSFTVNATIEDNVGVKVDGYGGIILNNSIEKFRFNGQMDSEIYHFPWEVPTNMEEGNYEMQIFAEDDMGNRGFDNVTLKIDLTAPEIILVSPANSSIYDQTIPIELNVTDEKSSVDNSSVFYKISEIVNGTFCPNTGIIFGNYTCYNSGWIPTQLNITSGYYEDEFNATNVTSGSYYFEAKAEDILGNEGVL